MVHTSLMGTAWFHLEKQSIIVTKFQVLTRMYTGINSEYSEALCSNQAFIKRIRAGLLKIELYLIYRSLNIYNLYPCIIFIPKFLITKASYIRTRSFKEMYLCYLSNTSEIRYMSELANITNN